ncbi:DUF3515 domain-containing protein [Nocardia sp. BMG111209]|uniref:DUF3515 domain-containing protein n=1 Tax=Nocardia sp. BMG111209 TaxID=1160137 RepID=UPI00037A4F5C|nr:DUF3515 domain-containing protein [Nocardia sp. BMG111209]
MSSETEQPTPEPRPTPADAAESGVSPTAVPETAAAPEQPGTDADGAIATPDTAASATTPDTASAATGDTTPAASPHRASPALIATAIALPVALIAGVLVLAVLARQNPARGPLALGSVSAPAATGPACTALLPALPATIGDYHHADLADPAPPATAAWQSADAGDPIVLRCGLDRPQEFDKAAALQVVDGVNWFALRDPAANTSSGTYFAVDRGTYIALTLPDHAGPTPLQEISDTIAKVLPARPIDPGPLPN